MACLQFLRTMFAEATTGLIHDGIHLQPALIGIIWKALYVRVNIVADAMAASSMLPGVFVVGRCGYGHVCAAPGCLT